MNPAIYTQPLILFLGAGASVPLGKKATVEFYEWVRSQVEVEWQFLLANISNHIEPSEEVNKTPDVEAVLDFLEKLIEAGKLLEKVGDAKKWRNLEKEFLEKTKILRLRPMGEASVTDLDKNIRLRDQIKDLVVTHYSEIDRDKAFELYQLLLEGFPLSTLPVFTTNYDLAIEKAFGHPDAQFRLIDGFERRKRTTPEWSGHSYQDYEPSEEGHDVILFKLHGSVDWHLTPTGTIQRVETRQRDPGKLKTILIYPSRQKREIHDEPFRTSYDYLFACLTYAKICVIIGFSFRDQEIVEELRAAKGINSNLRLLIMDPNVDSIAEHLSKKLGFEPSVIPLKVEFTPEIKDRFPSYFEEILKRRGW